MRTSSTSISALRGRRRGARSSVGLEREGRRVDEDEDEEKKGRVEKEEKEERVAE